MNTKKSNCSQSERVNHAISFAIGIHTHLLSSHVAFDRLFDKIALHIFAKQFGMDRRAFAAHPYRAYTEWLLSNIRSSEYVQKVVLFGVDAKVDDAGKVLHRDKTVCASNDDVLKLYADNPDVIIPFFSINPKRPDALAEMDRCIAAGCRGAKFLQNYWAVDTREKRYRPYFEKLAECKLPLIIHTGNESCVPSVRACEGIEMLQQPLDLGITVISAHMAIRHTWWHPFRLLSKNPKYFYRNYFTLLEMLQRYENLYADISSLLTVVRANVLRHLSEQTQVHQKLLFGTDFPVPFTTIFNTYDLSWQKRRAISKIKNPFDRYAAAMLEYFPTEHTVYTNYQKVLTC